MGSCCQVKSQQQNALLKSNSTPSPKIGLKNKVNSANKNKFNTKFSDNLPSSPFQQPDLSKTPNSQFIDKIISQSSFQIQDSFQQKKLKPHQNNEDVINQMDLSEYESDQDLSLNINEHDYLKGDLICQGQHGAVCWCLDQNQGVMYCLKLISHELFPLLSHADVETFKAQVLKLKHDNLVNYLQINYSKERPGSQDIELIMEYVSGGSVRNLLTMFGKFTEIVACLFTKQILQGLNQLHKNNIIHRNLKSSNILVESNGKIKISDAFILPLTVNKQQLSELPLSFKKSSSSTHQNEEVCESEYAGMHTINTDDEGDVLDNCILETEKQQQYQSHGFFWCSPEVITHGVQEYTPKSDIWAVGCILFEMLTAHPIFAKSGKLSPAQIVSFICDEKCQKYDFPKDSEDRPSDQCLDFLSKTLNFYPAKRQTCEQLLQHKWLQGVVVDLDEQMESQVISSKLRLPKNIMKNQKEQNQNYNNGNQGQEGTNTNKFTGKFILNDFFVNQMTGSNVLKIVESNKAQSAAVLQYPENSQQQQHRLEFSANMDQLNQQKRSKFNIQKKDKPISDQVLPNSQKGQNDKQQIFSKNVLPLNLNSFENSNPLQLLLNIKQQLLHSQLYNNTQQNLNNNTQQNQNNQNIQNSDQKISFFQKNFDTNKSSKEAEILSLQKMQSITIDQTDNFKSFPTIDQRQHKFRELSPELIQVQNKSEEQNRLKREELERQMLEQLQNLKQQSENVDFEAQSQMSICESREEADNINDINNINNNNNEGTRQSSQVMHKQKCEKYTSDANKGIMEESEKNSITTEIQNAGDFNPLEVSSKRQILKQQSAALHQK